MTGPAVSAGQEARRVIRVMGTVVSIHATQVEMPDRGVDSTFDAVEQWLNWVDQTFSTYRADSQISRLGQGELNVEECHPDVAAVLHACAAVQTATDGYFAARIAGRLDPSALVKGWAAQRSSVMLRDAGLTNHTISAGGDVVCAGWRSAGEPWRVGVTDPHQPGRLLAIIHVTDAAVATSGTAERGAHVVDPRTGRPARGLASVTVVGPDLGTADAYATAVLASGHQRPPWFDTLAGYELLTVAADGHTDRTAGLRAR
ncbi:MAG TPA: FAD:protein FMN transferase [Jiangellaceae bacterium]